MRNDTRAANLVDLISKGCEIETQEKAELWVIIKNQFDEVTESCAKILDGMGCEYGARRIREGK